MLTATMPAGRTSLNGNGRATKAAPESVRVPTLDQRTFSIQVVGVTPLIVHAFSNKHRHQIEEKQQKRAKTAKAARDPQQEVKDCFYLMPGSGPAMTAKAKYGFPAAAFKKAAVSACRFVDGFSMVVANMAFHVLEDAGGYVALETSKPRPRTDTVRIGGIGKTLDIRYRPEFTEWKCTLRIRYNASHTSPEQIVNLFHHAGFHVGVGEMRPEKGGYSCGMFEVRTAEPKKATRKRKY